MAVLALVMIVWLVRHPLGKVARAV
jgi:hypothetical protein